MAQSVNSIDLLAALESVAAGNMPTDLCNDNVIRERFLEACRKASHRLEKVTDTTLRIAGEVIQLPVCKLAIDLGIFEAVMSVAEGDSESAKSNPVTFAALVDKTGAEPAMLKRIMDFLASHWMVEEIGQGLYAQTNVTRNLTQREGRGTVITFNEILPSFQAIPLFLSQTGYKLPTDPANCPLQLGLNTKNTFFPWLAEEPERFAAFNDSMTITRSSATLCDIYPFAKLFENAKSEDVLFVDIGGNVGHQCARLLGCLPRSIQGRVILQDLPSVLSSIPESTLPPEVEAMPYDFFTVQPVRKAHAYYVRAILHDWADEKAVAILKNTVSAMGPESVLLIDEIVLPEKGARWTSTIADICMMSLLAAVERTERRWESLLAEAGLRIVKLWPYGSRGHAIIECRAI